MDALYDVLIVRPVLLLSRVVLWRAVDRSLVDGSINGWARLVRVGGEGLRLSQSGNLRLYLFFLFAGVMALLGWMILGTTWAS